MKPQSDIANRVGIVENNTSDNSRSNFLSHVSHGIRTPLNSIVGFSKLLLERQLIDGKPKEYAKRIVYSSNVLLNFVENLIDLSQYDTNNYTVNEQSVKINSLLWNIAEDFIIRKIEKDYSEIELSVNTDPENEFLISTDFELLKKSLNRLVDLVATIYKNGKIELGYCIENENVLKIYVRKNNDEYFKQLAKQGFQENDEEENAFDYFNFEVLVRSVQLIGGRVCTDSIMNEYSIEIPLK